KLYPARLILRHFPFPRYFGTLAPLLARMLITIEFQRKDAHHGLASRAIDGRGAASRQRRADLASQRAHPRKDARDLAVAQRSKAPEGGGDRRCRASHGPAVCGCIP